MTATREQVVAEARSWLGVRWRHQGRSRTGIDCVGFIVVVYKALGLSDYDSTGYGRVPDGSFMRHFPAAGGTRIPLANARPGDVMVFRQVAFPCHLGFLTEKNGLPHVIHSDLRHRQVIEEHLSEYGMRIRVAAFRLPGVID